jgi:hypothetical protein
MPSAPFISPDAVSRQRQRTRRREEEGAEALEGMMRVRGGGDDDADVAAAAHVTRVLTRGDALTNCNNDDNAQGLCDR